MIRSDRLFVTPTKASATAATPRRSGRGFALLLVLWTLVLIAFLVAHMTASGRVETRIAGNLVANAEAAAAADGAIWEAVFNLSDPRPEARWPIDGSARTLAIGASRVTLRLDDEAARINPSLVSPELMAALLRAVGSDPDTAARLTAAIGDWTGTSAEPRPEQQTVAEYRAAGLNYGPPSEPLESLDELGRVLGMTPNLLAALRPHLTLYGPAVPDPTHADPIVAAALAATTTNSETPAAPRPPGADLLTVRITARAEGPGNARVTRGAVIRAGAMLPHGYAVLAWGSRVD